MIRIHKEVQLNNDWHHEGGVILRDLDDDRAVSIFIRYCIGTPILEGERFGSTVTALDYAFSQEHIKPDSVFLFRARDIARLRKLWGDYLGDFDKDVGYFLWESGDIAAYPDEVMQNKNKWHFEDYRMFIWAQ